MIPRKPQDPALDPLNVSLEEKRRRNAAMKKLLEEWAAEEATEEDEKAFAEFEKALKENRKCPRCSMIQKHPSIKNTVDPLDVSPEERQRRMAAGLALVRKWAEEDSTYDEEVLPELMKNLDETREASGYARKLFHD
jgi:hypothetical protein